jgi:hypothetical protein
LSALDTAVTQLPLGLATLFGTVLGARLYGKVGAKNLAIAGVTLGGVAAWQLSALIPTSGGPQMWPWLTIVGLGVALTLFPLQTLAMQRITGAALARAASLYAAGRLVMASMGGAVLATLFVQQATYHGNALKAPALGDLPTGVTLTTLNLTSPKVQAAIQQLAAQAGTLALNDVFAYIAACSLLVLLLTLALPGRRVQVAEREMAESAHTEVPAL